MANHHSAPPNAVDLTGVVPAARRDPAGADLSLVPVSDADRVFAAIPTPYLVVTTSAHIVAVNDALAARSGKHPNDLIGRELLAVLEGLPEVDGTRVVAALARAQEGDGHQTITIPDPFDRGVTADPWILVASDVPTGAGHPSLVLLRVEEIGPSARAEDAYQGMRAPTAETDPTVLAEALATALRDKDIAASRFARLNDFTLQLSSAETVAELEQIVVGHGLPILGADGGAIAELDGHGGVRLATEPLLADPGATRSLHSAMPAVYTARTGRRVLLPTEASGLGFAEEMADLYRASGRRAWAFLPLRVREDLMGSLAVSWVDEQEFGPDLLALLDAFAAQCAQSLLQIRRAQARRDDTRELERLAEALQQALLTPPPDCPDLHIAVRYRPAVHQAQVGGDWYDAFVQPDGDVMLAIGDVIGHDSTAAASMGQLRGLLRSLAYCTEDALLPDTPAASLSRTEHAARGLAVDSIASTLLARVGGRPEDGRDAHVVRWSNAGHLPPLVVHPDGRSELWESVPDLLLGVDPRTRRHDHEAELPDGSTLILFTDGLVERRGSGLDDGLRQVRSAVADLGSVDLEVLCDVLLSRMTADGGEDDIALLAVRHRAAA